MIELLGIVALSICLLVPGYLIYMLSWKMFHRDETSEDKDVNP